MNARMPVRFDCRNELAPIVLFVYNRPEHTRRTVQSLLANDLARSSDLFIYSDAPRDDAAAAATVAVRDFVRTIEGFRSVTIIERNRNLGLARSVISGVTEICDKFGRAVVVEDDLLLSPDYLSFLNSALDQYSKEPKVFSVSGFNYGVV